ncbi:hypothetical protein [Polaribacter dokdonensis]|uniref:Lipocalin-like domain-containing protein n=1 Tax=Polaribacter dokdonensis DSW-5 TaxID=1300348 RepID=A0A0N0CF87_9FLAO|nr:hypothetical protein [Polaribacter dokdonensis]KOY51534.1 hypothetical protein I602_1094 [Polaribacter dokdonensis DSW-5]SEE09250.1 hypothetical protein SAMN05444353_0682 [Polaribacter dokdonensis DSW-5]
MKNIKFILFLCLSTIFVSCGDDNNDTPLLLTNANLAGSYSIGSLTGEEQETATSSSGAVVDLATSNIVGDTFQVDLLINTNGTYSISGLYREVKNTTPNGGSTTETTSILTTDTNGTYQLNGINNTITFTPINGDFLADTFNVNNFNSTIFSINQEGSEASGSNTITSSVTIDFVRE